MIFFFSATGNSWYVAQRIAEATGEKTISITDCIKNGQYRFALQPGEMLGFVTPVYVGCLPSVVADYIRQFDIGCSGGHYTWHTVTYGRVEGYSSRQMALLLSEKNISIEAGFSVKMLSNYSILFDLNDKEDVQRRLAEAEPEIDDVIEKILSKTVNENAGLPSAEDMENLQKMQVMYDKVRRTGPFYVLENCSSCGECADLCSCGAVQMEDGKPVWTQETCAMCLGCLHRCPRFAIQYAGRTEAHGQYLHPGLNREI